VSFHDVYLELVVPLTKDKKKASSILSLAGIIPGFDKSGDEKLCRVRLPLAETAEFRDIIIELWSIARPMPGAKLSLGGKEIDLSDLKDLWRVMDCFLSSSLGRYGADHCRSKSSGGDWGCLFLTGDSLLSGIDDKTDREKLKNSIRREAERLRLHLCPRFDLNKALAGAESITDQTLALMKQESTPLKTLKLMEGHQDKSEQSREAIPRVSYADIGGLDQVVSTLREIIELPFRHPEILERMGIIPHKGILLHGPPGCGKTLLARAVACESGATFIPISGPELITKWHGESEEKLRQIFARAQDSQPAIIFFDEIDAIAQPRSMDESLRIDSRFTAQLLTLMDGIHDPGQVVVLGATNRPDLLDEALLRPGRFDAVIEIPRPDLAGCLKILGIHASKLPLAGDVNLKSFARKLQGLTGADIAYVVREAAYTALRRSFSLEEVLSEGKELSEQELTALTVTTEDFHTSLDKLLARNFSTRPGKKSRKQKSI